MTRGTLGKALLAFGIAMILGLSAKAAETLDTTPRTAVASAFQPEWVALQTALQERKRYTVNGTTFDTGHIEGKPVVLFLSGISMVNAAMTSQLALDRFTVARIVFSGIAGGVDPRLAIGDVVVPAQWSEYLESVFARERDGAYVLPGFADKSVPNFGMMFPQPVGVANSTDQPEKRWWFPVDSALLSIARTVVGIVRLNACAADGARLAQQPKVIVGGNGVSGPSFVDNAAFREYAQKTFGAEVLDMESAAVAHVAYANKVPFIAFRSLSDLAGGGRGRE
jgi:adenosylhomocysteine nucleosidase